MQLLVVLINIEIREGSKMYSTHAGTVSEKAFSTVGREMRYHKSSSFTAVGDRGRTLGTVASADDGRGQLVDLVHEVGPLL